MLRLFMKYHGVLRNIRVIIEKKQQRSQKETWKILKNKCLLRISEGRTGL
jgi:hypothetical protein